MAVACGASVTPPLPPPVARSASLETAPGARRIESVAQSCAKISSCAHAHDAPRELDPSACVDWWLARIVDGGDSFADCVAAARDCVAIDVCVERRGNPVAAEYCRGHARDQTACDGGRLITCADDDPRESALSDCTAMHAACGEVKGAGGLTSRACVSAALCPKSAPQARCDGAAAIVTCRDDEAIDRDECPAGAHCEETRGEDGEPTAFCVPRSHEHCNDVGKRRCDGAKLVQCAPHGQFGEIRTVDCAAFDLTCDASGARDCVVPGVAECAANAPSGAPKCDGGALVFCAAGKHVRVGCEELGFGACDPDGHGLAASCGTSPGAARVTYYPRDP